MKTVLVNGVEYAPNLPTQRKPRSKRLLSMMAIASIYGGMRSTYSPKTSNVDIVKEYELIQNKKSNLSKKDRDGVVYMFERNYTKVEPITIES